MTAPASNNAPRPNSRPGDAGGRGPFDDWVVVMEFVPVGGPCAFSLHDIDTLFEHLREWRVVGLWSQERYAVQLTISAPNAHEALKWAFHYHREGAREAGLAPVTMVRSEVCTNEEMERAWDEGDEVVARQRSLFCPDLYYATRDLLAATTPAELAETLTRFVTAVGGRVEPGRAIRRKGTLQVDIGMSIDHPRHAVAEDFSVAGLILEQTLPTLVDDARLALGRLLAHKVQPEPAMKLGTAAKASEGD